MSFDVAAVAYDRYMGRYSSGLAAPFADLAGVGTGWRVLDVGCGPGALTAELVSRVGAANVSAVDPSAPFIAAVRDRNPGVDVRQAPSEDLPYADATFDAALAQLVVHFMTDPVAGLREMARVATPGGVVAASVWDFAGGRGPVSIFWQVAATLDPKVEDESALAGAGAGRLSQLMREAGLDDVAETSIAVRARHETFDEWWDPFTLGVGPAGAYVAGLDAEQLARLRDRCRAALPTPPFTVTMHAWAARGQA